jgi:hypothetical protein
MNDLTELERAVLTELLAGDHPLLEQLRNQLAHCRVSRRKYTGVGFWTDLDVGGNAPAVNDMKLRFGDVIADIDGMAHGAGFVLFIEHGLLSNLEGYGYDDPWPSTITGYTLKYRAGENRDWAALKKVLG